MDNRDKIRIMVNPIDNTVHFTKGKLGTENIGFDLWAKMDSNQTLFENIERIMQASGEAHNVTNIQEAGKFGGVVVDYDVTYNLPEEKVDADFDYKTLMSDTLHSLKNKNLDINTVNFLIKRYDRFNNKYAKIQEEKINQKLSDTPYQVAIYETSDFYDDTLSRDKSNEYWNLTMFEAFVVDKYTKEPIYNTVTKKHVEIDSVVEELNQKFAHNVLGVEKKKRVKKVDMTNMSVSEMKKAQADSSDELDNLM